VKETIEKADGCIRVSQLAHMWLDSVIIETGLITMYSNRGHIEDVRKMFDAKDHPHIGIWNANQLLDTGSRTEIKLIQKIYGYISISSIRT
jgi:hypothetical protein